MSGTIYEVPLPNGTIVEVEGVGSGDAARARARLYFQQTDPEGYAAWSAQQPAAGFGERFSRGIDESQGRLYGFAEAAGAASGVESLEQFGRRGVRRNILEAEQSAPEARLRSFGEAEGVGGVLRAGQQAIAGSAPDLPLPLAGAIAGAKYGQNLLSPLGVRGRVVGGFIGGTIGAAVGSYPSLVGSNVERQRQVAAQQAGGVEPERIPAPGTALAAAVPQALIGGAFDALTLRAARVLGVPAGEVGLNLFPRIARGLGYGALTEVPEEVLQTVIERAQAGLPVLGDDAMRDYTEAAAGGFFAGAAFGGTAAGVFGQRPARPTQPATGEPPEGEAAAAAGPEPTGPVGPAPLVGDRPEPFATPEEAADYLATARLPPSLTDPGARLAWANARRQAEWENTVEQARPVALSEFTATPPADAPAPVVQTANETFFNNLAQAAATDQISLTRFTPQQIANYAFASRGIQGAKPSKPELDAIVQRLDALVQQNLLEKPSDGLYRISTTDQPAPAATTVPRAPAADPGAPAVNASPAMQTATAQEPAVAQAEQTLTGIAQTGTPVQTPPQVDANLWRAYSLAYGPRVGDPLVLAARDVDRALRRQLSLNEFQTFANAWNALPSDTDRAIFMEQARQNARMLGARGGPEVTAPAPAPSAPLPTAAAAAAAPPTPPAPPQPTATPSPAGFTTARGSTYEINEAGQTIRTKRSEGPGQGTTYPPHNVLYVTPEQSQDILEEMRGRNRYRFVVDDNGTARTLQPGETIDNRRAGIAIVRPDGSVDRVIPARTTPAVGLSPVELAYEETPDGFNASRHIGNPITELRGRPPAEPVAEPAAPTPEAEPVVVEDPDAEPPADSATDAVDPPERRASPQADTDVRDTPSAIYGPLTGALPNDPALGIQVIGRASRSLFDPVLRFFASPILTLPKVRSFMKPPAAVARLFLRRTNQYNSEIQNLLAKDIGKFTVPEMQLMHDRLMESSRLRRPLNEAGMTPEMIAKAKEVQLAHQRSFDYFAEAYLVDMVSPIAAKTPEARARLQRMWERNKRKTVLQIADAELKAASPEAHKLRQRLQALRNPYHYTFSAGNHTHFIAAYAKGPDGRRKPGAKVLKMVPITPPPSVFKLPGAPDPVAAAKRELAKYGFTEDRYYVTPEAVEFTRDQEARKIRDDSDIFAKFTDQLSTAIGSNAEAQRQLRNMIDALEKTRMERIFRPNQDILIPTTDINNGFYLKTTVPQILGGLGKLQAKRYTEGSYRRATENLPPAWKTYADNHREYMTVPVEAAWISRLRSLGFHMFLGAAIDSALVNGTQCATSTLPLLTRDGGAQGAKIFTETVIQVFANFNRTVPAAARRDLTTFIERFTKDLGRNADEAKAIRRAADIELFTPILTTEAGGVTNVDIREQLVRRGIKNPEFAQWGTDVVLNISGLPQRTVETLNRATAFLAAYRLAKAKPEVIARVNRLEDRNLPDAFEYAVSRVDDSQFITTPEDRARFMRLFPGAELLTQFMSHPMKMTEIFLMQGRNSLVGLLRQDAELAKAGALGIVLYSAPLIALAGIWGLPMADFLRQSLEEFIKFFWQEPRNFRDELRYALGDGFLAQAISNGLPHAWGAVSLSGRLAIDPLRFDTLADWSVLNVFGPVVGSSAQMVADFYNYAKRGDYLNALASVAPRVVGNALKGANLAYGTQEYRTPEGAVMISRDQLREIDQDWQISVAVRQAIGFPSPAVVDLREGYRIARDTQQQNRPFAESINNKLALAEADRLRGQRDGNAEQVADARRRFQEAVLELEERNRRFVERKEFDRVHNVNWPAIQRQAREMFYGRTSPEIMGRTGRPAMRAEIQEIQQRYAPR